MSLRLREQVESSHRRSHSVFLSYTGFVFGTDQSVGAGLLAKADSQLTKRAA